jgi:hypothetical protein
MTQVWPGFGVAPVPTLLSDICKPDAVVMVFPAVWAAAGVGENVSGMVKMVIAIAEASENLADRKRRILKHLPLRSRRV